MTRGSGAAAPAPEVSVLVPIYNVERYLERCLTSLVGQTYDDFEAICINDGSTDGSRAIIQRFLDADSRFRVIDKENSGYGASMNRGLDVACGRYVAILESDDFFEPDALAVLHEAAEMNQAEVVKANFYLYWSRPEERRELFRVVDEVEAGHVLRPLDDLAVFFRKPSIWSALYRRDFLVDDGIRFLETPGASYQDSGFNFKVWASARRVAFLAAPVLNYRQDNEGSSVNNPGKVFCVCDEYASMEEFVRARGSADERRLLAILQRMKLDSYLWNYDRLAPELRPAFVERAAKEFRAAFKRGEVDLALFEPAAEADLRAMVADPAAFCVERDAAASAGAAGALRRYLRMGGPALVSRVLWFRLFGRSARRIDAQGAAL
ncbi:glycosyltransferase family 2 protein [Thermophilibacter provencensis]|uniref:Glycosyltransferase n=1 Tax=Thermophilibacter provencensis TaxID=1852386 RepID=A0A921GE71_9ACTN|nr:glycosyltransferase [Thermophilibacter provencensis]HJF44356.1 glycosyltransferase [Thermophilibacter provencensis]